MPRFFNSTVNSSALRASRAAEVATAVRGMSPWMPSRHSSMISRKRSICSSTRCIAAGSKTPHDATPSPKFVIAWARRTSCTPDASTSATSRRHVTVPMSIAANRCAQVSFQSGHCRPFLANGRQAAVPARLFAFVRSIVRPTTKAAVGTRPDGIIAQVCCVRYCYFDEPTLFGSTPNNGSSKPEYQVAGAGTLPASTSA